MTMTLAPLTSMSLDVAHRRRRAEDARAALARFTGGVDADVAALLRDERLANNLPRDVAESWGRALGANIDVRRRFAPISLSDLDLDVHRRRLGWVSIAERCLLPQVGLVDEIEHVLTLFDADGVMVASAGHHRTLQGLGDIHFFDGANWHEDAVGTNGPGTALSTGRAVHIVGPEHYCEAWHGWHCAAAPVRDPDTDAILGVVDVSGFVDAATPTALMLAMSMAAVVEGELRVWSAERRARVLARYAELLARHPGDGAVAFDARGRRVASTTSSLDALVLPAKNATPTSAWSGRFSQLPDGAVVTPLDDDGIHLGAVVQIPNRSRGVRTEIALPAPTASSSTATSPATPTSTPTPTKKKPTATRYSFDDVAGDSVGVQQAKRLALAAAKNKLPVVILGESGVGKEVLAQSIHEASARRGAFVAVNCGAMPATLVESELFGYVGGAYSGARREGSAGKFQAAEGGTLFLDEIGDLPLPAQTALLRALQEEEVTPVGATAAVPVDVRIVAATHRDLPKEIEAGRFRADLFYRLNILAIEVPPLRARVDDIPLLAERFLVAAADETGRTATLSPEAKAALVRWSWPGNVRELKNLMRRMSAVGAGPEVLLTDLPQAMWPTSTASSSSSSSSSSSLSAGDVDPRRQQLIQAINAASTMSDAARQLGITRSHLYRQLQRFGLKPGRHARDSASP